MTANTPLQVSLWTSSSGSAPGFLPLCRPGYIFLLVRVLGVVIAFAWELAAHTPRLCGKGSYQLIMFNFLGLREPFWG